jgi:hypothetical protein
VSRCPARVLINKGFTLEVMCEYERAVDTLNQAGARLDRQADPRLWNLQRLNLATNFCFLGRYQEAADLAEEVEPLVAAAGDKLDRIRILGLRARIAAGLGRPLEALQLFAEARRRFAAETMSYDVALALLEEAVLLLDEGRTAEVKVLALELNQVFDDKGVHREALAALWLFYEAAERETATADLARRVLRYLYRARYDRGLPFTS